MPRARVTPRRVTRDKKILETRRHEQTEPKIGRMDDLRGFSLAVFTIVDSYPLQTSLHL